MFVICLVLKSKKDERWIERKKGYEQAVYKMTLRVTSCLPQGGRGKKLRCDDDVIGYFIANRSLIQKIDRVIAFGWLHLAWPPPSLAYVLFNVFP